MQSKTFQKILRYVVHYFYLDLGTRLFVPWPGDSEVTFLVFKSSYPLLLPV